MKVTRVRHLLSLEVLWLLGSLRVGRLSDEDKPVTLRCVDGILRQLFPTY